MKTSRQKPYDYFPAMEKLRTDRSSLSHDEVENLKAQVALNAADPEAVALFVDIYGDEWADIYPPVPKADVISTEQAIDTFITTYGKPSPKEDELLERLIFNPVPDYSTVLARQEGDETEPDDTMLDSLARKINPERKKEADRIPTTETAEEKPVVTPAEPEVSTEVKPDPPTASRQPSKSSLSFELAKIFIKQGHFERARDIISKIILNNPEKSVYFADQMRFLEKLIKIKQAQLK